MSIESRDPLWATSRHSSSNRATDWSPLIPVISTSIATRWTISKLIEEMAELNADHEYSYSDEELIQMLKEATAAQRK